MALHSSWKGYLKLSLVSVPVKAFAAIKADEGEIHFHQIHELCHNRIKYVKTCPIHGAVPADEIVSGYEYSKGHFVIVEKEELDRVLLDALRKSVETVESSRDKRRPSATTKRTRPEKPPTKPNSRTA